MRRGVLVAATMGGLVLLLVAAQNGDALLRGWTRARLRHDPAHLLTLIEREGDAWDLERVEALMGRDAAHALIGNLWFDLLEDEHFEASGEVVARLRAWEAVTPTERDRRMDAGMVRVALRHAGGERHLRVLFRNHETSRIGCRNWVPKPSSWGEFHAWVGAPRAADPSRPTTLRFEREFEGERVEVSLEGEASANSSVSATLHAGSWVEPYESSAEAGEDASASDRP